MWCLILVVLFALVPLKDARLIRVKDLDFSSKFDDLKLNMYAFFKKNMTTLCINTKLSSAQAA